MAAKKSAPKTMSEEARLKKNAQIRAAGMATRARRTLMDCRGRDLKIVANRLSRAQKTALRAVFLESKWIRNAALAAERFDGSILPELAEHGVPVRLLDGTFERRPLVHLGGLRCGKPPLLNSRGTSRPWPRARLAGARWASCALHAKSIPSSSSRLA